MATKNLIGAPEDDYRANVAPPTSTTDFFTGQSASFIEEERWNKQFPYQLVILKDEGGGGYSQEKGYVFTLPIPPESLSVSTPFAISTAVTLGGIIEQHNGVPIKLITFSGTTGVYPLRGTGDGMADPLSALGIANTIFAGTVQAATSAVNNGIAVFNGEPPKSPNQYEDRIDIDAIAPKGTGYYQFLLLKRFLENYAVMKKSAENRNLHLAMLIWKERTGYFVTPMRLDAQKSKDSPHEFRYNLQFTAWKAIDPHNIKGIGVPSARTSTSGVVRSPNLLAKVLNRIEYARNTLQAARRTILSIKPDFDATVGEVLRQTSLLLKDATGLVATAAADTPKSIIKGMQSTIESQWDNVKDAVLSGPASKDAKIKAAATQIDKLAKGLASGASKSSSASSPVSKIFDDPDQNYGLFSNIKVENLNLPAHVSSQIAQEKDRVRSFTKRDFETQRDQIKTFADDYAAKVGLSDETYDRTYGRDVIQPVRDATDDDHNVLWALNETIMQLNSLIANADRNPNTTVISTVEAIAGFAERSGVAFQVPTSKFLVPMPYGITLEQLAARYLGDADRWHEIAALNGLRSPYIDEAGFSLDLLTNVVGTTVTVADASNLFLGQSVILYSATVGQTKRQIIDIKKVSSNYYAITLNGEENLEDYTTFAESKLLAYLPGTVNSQQLIYIPSQAPSTIDPQLRSIPGVNDQDHLLNIGGIDLLLTPKGDLVITEDGDAKLAFGLTNITQYVKLTVDTPRGSLIRHPDFGFSTSVGTSMADFTAKDVLDSIKNMFRDDPTFTGIKAASVDINGPAMDVKIALGIAGSEQLVPISFTILGR